MADESNNQSTFSNIGLAVVAVLAAVTAARTFSIQDTRPSKPELGQGAVSQGAVVYAQLWQDPFQAVDSYFKTYKQQSDPRLVADAKWLADKFEIKINEVENLRSRLGRSAPPGRAIDVVAKELNYVYERLASGAVDTQEYQRDQNLLTHVDVLDGLTPGGELARIYAELSQDGGSPCAENDTSSSTIEKRIYNWRTKFCHLWDSIADDSVVPVPTMASLAESVRELEMDGYQLEELSFESKLDILAEATASASSAARLSHAENPGRRYARAISVVEPGPSPKQQAAQLRGAINQFQADQARVAEFAPTQIQHDFDPNEMERDVEKEQLERNLLSIGWSGDDGMLQSGVEQLEQQFTERDGKLKKLIVELEHEKVQIAEHQRYEDDFASANPCGLASESSDRLPDFDRPPNECVQGNYEAAGKRDKNSSVKEPSKADNNPKIIAVMVNDGSFSSRAEDRRRQRYGVITALEMSGYMPEDDGRIHLTQLSQIICTDSPDPYKDINDVNKTICDAAKQKPCQPQDQRGCVPFEKFRLRAADEQMKRGRSKEILLLWLRDENIFHLSERKGADGSTGLFALLQIAKNVYPRNMYHTSALAVLGPPNSGSLQALYEQYNTFRTKLTSKFFSSFPCGPEDDSCDQPHPGLHLFDVHATKGLPFELAPPITYTADPNVFEKFSFPECVPGNQTFCFSRTGVPDAKLAEALASELKRRGLDGRAFRTALLVDGASTLTLSLRDNLEKYLKAEVASAPGALPEDILSFYYYPLVDGKSSGEFSETGEQVPNGQAAETHQEHPADQKADAAGSSHLRTDITEAGDYATGDAQIDYIRRLGIALKAQNNKKPIGAIGVVSNDPYDTLDVIQTLRPLFPHALMFTTFVNAQMADRGVPNSTRGVIVASKFGLHTRPLSEDVRDIPEFRDQFETADFLTALYVAQCDISADKFAAEPPATTVCDNVKGVVDQKVPPGIFEVGASGFPHRLPKPLGATPTKPEDLEPDTLGSELSGIDRVLLGLGGLAAIGAIRLINGCAVRKSPGTVVRENIPWGRTHGRGFWEMVVAGAVVVGVMLFWPVVRDFLTESGNGEPLGWVDGIGLWPTVWIQIADFGLACWFIYLVVLTLNQSAVELSKKFGLFDDWYVRDRLLRIRLDTKVDQERDDGFDRFKSFVGSLVNAFDMRAPRLAWTSEDALDVKKYWLQYLDRCTVFARLTRSVAYSLAVALGIWFFDWMYPEDPLLARGSLVRGCYAWSAFMCSGAMILLVSLVFDATLNTGRFVRYVHRKDLRDSHGKRRDLPEETKNSLSNETKGSHWPTDTVTRYSERLGFGGFGVAGWIDLQFTRRRSKVILRFVWFPLVAAGLLIVAKGLADRATEAGFIAEAIIIGTMLIGCVVALRTEAEGQRKGFLRDLRRRLSWVAGTYTPAEEPRNGDDDLAARDTSHRAGSASHVHSEPTYGPATKEQIELLIKSTEALDEGAFASALSQPLVKALLVPIGAGVWPLLAQQLGR